MQERERERERERENEKILNICFLVHRFKSKYYNFHHNLSLSLSF